MKNINTVNYFCVKGTNLLYYRNFLHFTIGDELWCTRLGPVGFAKNGVAIYNALTGFGLDAVYYEEFDECQGHASPGGSYHYHQFSRKYSRTMHLYRPL